MVYRIFVMADRTVKLQIQLPQDLRTRFKGKCVLQSTTMNQIVVELIEAWTDGQLEERLNGKESESPVTHQ